jgi:sulfur-carrier protein
VKVHIPTPLRSYTGGLAHVEIDDSAASDVAAVLDALDRAYPGLRFRVVDEQGRLRRHMKVFVNDESVRELSTALAPTDDVTIMQALSGG